MSERGQRHKWPRSKQLKKMQEVLRFRNRGKWKVRVYIYSEFATEGVRDVYRFKESVFHV